MVITLGAPAVAGFQFICGAMAEQLRTDKAGVVGRVTAMPVPLLVVKSQKVIKPQIFGQNIA